MAMFDKGSPAVSSDRHPPHSSCSKVSGWEGSARPVDSAPLAGTCAGIFLPNNVRRYTNTQVSVLVYMPHVVLRSKMYCSALPDLVNVSSIFVVLKDAHQKQSAAHVMAGPPPFAASLGLAKDWLTWAAAAVF